MTNSTDKLQNRAMNANTMNTPSHIITLDLPFLTATPGYKHLNKALAHVHPLARMTPLALAEELNGSPPLTKVFAYFHALCDHFSAWWFLGGGYLKYSANDFDYTLLPDFDLDGHPPLPVCPNAVGAEGTTRHFRFLNRSINEHVKEDDSLSPDDAVKALVDCGAFLSGSGTDDVRVDIRTLDALALLRYALLNPTIDQKKAPCPIRRAITSDYEAYMSPHHFPARQHPRYPRHFLRERSRVKKKAIEEELTAADSIG